MHIDHCLSYLLCSKVPPFKLGGTQQGSTLHSSVSVTSSYLHIPCVLKNSNNSLQKVKRFRDGLSYSTPQKKLINKEKYHYPASALNSRFFNGMGLRLGNGISPAFLKGGVSQAIPKSFLFFGKKFFFASRIMKIEDEELV